MILSVIIKIMMIVGFTCGSVYADNRVDQSLVASSIPSNHKQQWVQAHKILQECRVLVDAVHADAGVLRRQPVSPKHLVAWIALIGSYLLYDKRFSLAGSDKELKNLIKKVSVIIFTLAIAAIITTFPAKIKDCDPASYDSVSKKIVKKVRDYCALHRDDLPRLYVALTQLLDQQDSESKPYSEQQIRSFISGLQYIVDAHNNDQA